MVVKPRYALDREPCSTYAAFFDTSCTPETNIRALVISVFLWAGEHALIFEEEPVVLRFFEVKHAGQTRAVTLAKAGPAGFMAFLTVQIWFVHRVVSIGDTDIRWPHA
jgi:hypothetical protein